MPLFTPSIITTALNSINIKKNTMLATLVGGVIGVGYAVLRFLFDNRLRTKEEAEKYLGIPVFCEIPEL